MTVVKCALFFLVLTCLWTFNRGDAEVSCVFMESCILPCSFPVGTDVLIHWIQVTAGDTVHSYYHNKDQLSHQHEHYRGRTSLFRDQISRGNASLQLTGVEVQDQGRYKCYTSTMRGNKDSFINLKVDAPVRQVDIQQVENRITCSSEGIYPEPELTWSTSPPSNVTFKNTTTVQQTEQQIYNISSSLILSDNVTDLVYSCTVSTRRNRRTATLFKPTSLSVSDSETTIPCTSSNTPLTGLIWRFNHSQIILSQTRADVPHTVSEEWQQQVKGVSESGSLMLQDLSSNQEGIYTCELSNAEETNITSTLLRIEKSQDDEVSCVFMESCILPCSFPGGTDVLIHWIQVTAGDTPVHSYYHNQDQLAHQHQRFRGRTSLFRDQISRGNASLQLTGVEVQDQGRYKCYTSTMRGNKVSFINLKVDAPVRQVDIQQVENRITCSSEGIYPEPELTWSTSPPSNVTLQDKPTVQQTEQQLYSISSSLTLSDSVTDLVYSCTVSTRRNRRRATLFKPTSLSVSDSETTTIPCTSSNTPLTGFIWRFNHSQIILNQTRADVPHTVSEEWRQQVKGVSESGSLTLQDLSLNQEGIYTCELSNAEETNITSTILRIEKSQDAEVSCVFMESCILPCSFPFETDLVIHWIQVTAGDTRVHSYYHNQDQLAHQDQRFRGRTSLFRDQISRGNASLQLTGVEVRDQGRYKCYTSTETGNKESFINLKVDAPVVGVDIQQVENRITCSSEGIYPEPELTWSTSPPSNVTLQDKPTVQQTEQQLYSISSSLIPSDSVTDLVYSCTVSTRRNRRRATLFKPTSLSVSDSETTTILCTSSNTPLTGFIWRFNHSQIILNQTRTDVPYTVSEEWRQQVKGVSESGSLTLQDLSLNQEGIYTCELSNAEETNITSTILRIEKSQGSSTSIGAIIGGVVVAILVIAAVVIYYKYIKKNR
ncbi:hemicentin-2-like isoform X2 [Siniperca chuatsi]|uniref:hemicentin-2-like isoform X2 n=1 Tax=Siniperca chuatsi TaxID=119488 RepID=UPI001CE1E2F5|nr:hemicentin-2-like isoform X2 [Siniperca chuatsi]